MNAPKIFPGPKGAATQERTNDAGHGPETHRRNTLVHVLGKDGSLKLTVPWPFLFGLTLLASLVGLYAARKPAKVAAKLNILQAIATE